jgi:phytoene synthase
VRRYDHDRYLTCLFAADDRREDLFAVYAFNLEIAKVAEVVSEPMAGRVRLQWWRETLDGVFDGAPRRHQVAEPLSATVRRGGLTRGRFETLIDARERDLEDAPPPSLEALESYAAASAAELVQLALEVLGACDEVSAAAGHHVGLAFALAGIARAVPFHAGQGRLMLPADLVREAGIDLHALLAGREAHGTAPVVEQVAARARAHLAEARRLRPEVSRAALPALLPAVLAERYLGLLEKAGYDPFAQTVQARQPGRVWRVLLAALSRRY